MDAYVAGHLSAERPPNLSWLSPELSAAIAQLRSRSSDEFLSRLEDRKKKERNWANFSRDREHLRPSQATEQESRSNARWYSTTQLSAEYRISWLAKHIAGRIVLDYACGDGAETLRAAKMGAALAMGIDVSDISIQNAMQVANREGLSERCVFLEGDCEATGLPDNSIDVILCCGMLHHLDLARAYPEMQRILKPGGRVFAQEALNYNPIIKLYRQLTPQLRTEWEKEHILSLKDVRAAQNFFDIGEVRYWHLTSVLGACARSVPSLLRVISPVLNGVDRLVLSIPGLRLMAWQFTFELIKRG